MFRKGLVKSFDGDAEYYLTVPKRVLSAVDVSRTTIRVYDGNIAGDFFRKIDFVDGVFFSDLVDRGVGAFWDYDYGSWMWSDEMLSRCKADGVRGLLAKRTGGEIRGVEYRL